ncbi:restriction endonuclease subunit S [Vibrio parahaemolyticus]
MSFEIKKATLGDFLNFKNGKKSPERADNASFPVFGSNGLIGRAESTNCPENTIVIGRVGSYCGSVHFSKEKCWVSDNAISCSSKNAGEEHFWFYVLTKLNLNQFSSGSGQPLLNQATLNAVECEVPNNSPLRALIGSVLNDYDKKIKLNAATNQTLEQMAQAIFKSWFVDFDPVKAKMNGEQPEGMDAATASLFPEKLVESELGLIPEGWSVRPLGCLIDFMTGFAFKSKQFTESGVRLARGDNVKEGRFHWGDKSRYWPDVTPELEKYHLQSGDILIGMDGSKVGKNWVRVNESDLPCLLVQRVARLREKGLVGSSMLEVIIGGNKFKRYVENVKTGTSIPHISGKQIKDMPILYPNDGGKLFQRFEELLLPLAQKRELNNAENQELTRLRDTLLPKLLSGEIELGTSEELVEAI